MFKTNYFIHTTSSYLELVNRMNDQYKGSQAIAKYHQCHLQTMRDSYINETISFSEFVTITLNKVLEYTILC